MQVLVAIAAFSTSSQVNASSSIMVTIPKHQPPAVRALADPVSGQMIMHQGMGESLVPPDPVLFDVAHVKGPVLANYWVVRVVRQ